MARQIVGGDVTTALGFTPYGASNPNGFITSSALNGYATESFVTAQISANGGTGGGGGTAYTLPTGSPTVRGGFRIDGTTLVANGDLLSANPPVSVLPSSLALAALDGTQVGVVFSSGDVAYKVPVRANAADYPIGVFQPGLPYDGQTLLLHTLAKAITLPAGMAGTSGKARVAATASSVFTLSFTRAGTTTRICTLSFAASGTIANVANVVVPTLAAGDDLLLTGPATADATLADIGFTILGTKT